MCYRSKLTAYDGASIRTKFLPRNTQMVANLTNYLDEVVSENMFIASALLKDLEVPSRLSRLALTSSVDAHPPLGGLVLTS